MASEANAQGVSRVDAKPQNMQQKVGDCSLNGMTELLPASLQTFDVSLTLRFSRSINMSRMAWLVADGNEVEMP